MKLYIKYNINAICKKILEEQLDKLDLNYSVTGFGEVDIKENVSNEKLKQLGVGLNDYGIEIVESHKSILVQKIKDAITEMVYLEEKLPTSKISSYLADKIGHSYGYIYNLFSEVTHTSIGNYIILQKTERAKQLMTTTELTFTEIAWKLNYSSVAHFSNQFKNATGITPTAFQRIMNKRRNKVPTPEPSENS
ncbi:MAG TPA: helix-turn-helix transcriptional regulator [Cytophagaceae bacterium]|jgi:AraC-like DNA-binding protein|nr:helix-turn-helix transcriptional regulator [Cytophagaceae bacterium]